MGVREAQAGFGLARGLGQPCLVPPPDEPAPDDFPALRPGPGRLRALLPLGRLLRPHLIHSPLRLAAIAMMLALLFLSLATFGYLGYVLLEPEKF